MGVAFHEAGKKDFVGKACIEGGGAQGPKGIQGPHTRDSALSNCHMGGLGTTLVQGVNASSTVNGSCHGAMVCAGLPTRVNG